MTLILCGFSGLLAAFGYIAQFHFHDSTLFFIALSSLVISSLSIISEKWNLVYLLRFVLLIVPGILTSYLLQTQPIGTIVMNYAALIQTREISIYVALLTALALSGHGVGWAASRELFKTRPIATSLESETISVYFWFYLVIAIISSTFLSIILGPFIWDSSYTALHNPPPFGFGSYNFFVAVSLLGAFLSLIYENNISKFKLFIFTATIIYSLFFCMLFRGMRSEFVGVWVGLTTLFLLRYRVQLKGWQIISVFVGGYIFVMGWGAFRASASSGFKFTDALIYMQSRVRTYDYFGNYLFQTSTFGDIAATLYNSITLLAKDAISPLNGQSYFDYALRTLPQIIYPDRPRDLSFIFYDNYVPYGGGIFELSEAYLNFLMPGCFFIPAIISFGIGRVYFYTVQARTFTSFFATGVLTAALFRGTLYQSFVFYRALTVFFVLHLTAMIIDNVIKRWFENEKKIN
ncbi:MAG: hypothetical protein KA715_05360 [Xanthomonadaceae bacterium]|nr:hypothetical protein [Xanthomonadaceae bacterium]